MNINIKATNTTLTDSIKQNISDKLLVLETFLRPEHKVFVELAVDPKHKSGATQRVEISVSPGSFYADSAGADFYEALDLAIPKIKEQLSRQKDKKVSLRRKLGAYYKRVFRKAR